MTIDGLEQLQNGIQNWIQETQRFKTRCKENPESCVIMIMKALIFLIASETWVIKKVDANGIKLGLQKNISIPIESPLQSRT